MEGAVRNFFMPRPTVGFFVRMGTVALLLPPCLGTLMNVRGEQGLPETGKMILWQLILAWAVGWLLHTLLHLLTLVFR